jgi:thioester reductase-like protein
VAEQIVKLAQERGIPATIHRPGVVSGDSVTGAGNTRDMIWNMMKGCIQLGIGPERDFPIDVTPVDYVSRAIVHLSLRPDSVGHAFHFPNPAPMRWTAALPFLRSRGYDIETVPQRQWQRTAAEVAPRIPDSALLPFLPLLAPPQTLAEETRLSELELPTPPAAVNPLEPRYDSINTEAGLAGSGIACPPVDEALLGSYLDYFVRIGWLPEPREVEKAVGVEKALTP